MPIFIGAPINFGKREPGALTAASPGDTLVIPFATYNDSGASIGIGGALAVTDIEIFKNGGPVPRATDSGYSLISDTGQFGNLVGLHRFSVQLFNTADDTGFYDVGSSYQVAVDSITVDGRTVRFLPAVFEIGLPAVNVEQLDGDTGFAERLGQFADNVSATGIVAADVQLWQGSVVSGTGGIPDVNMHEIDDDTGAANRLQKLAGIKITDSGTFDTGTGQLQGADTGEITNAVWDSLRSAHTGAGSFGASDTGINSRFDALATDTGGVNVSSLSDTGINDRLARILADTDTGIQGGVNVISIADTGLNNRLDVIAADTDTGIQSSVNVTSLSDTGLNDRLATIESDTGASAKLDAIKTKTDSLTFTVAGHVDSNIQSVNDVTITGTGDTGTADTWRPA